MAKKQTASVSYFTARPMAAADYPQVVRHLTTAGHKSSVRDLGDLMSDPSVGGEVLVCQATGRINGFYVTKMEDLVDDNHWDSVYIPSSLRILQLAAFDESLATFNELFNYIKGSSLGVVHIRLADVTLEVAELLRQNMFLPALISHDSFGPCVHSNWVVRDPEYPWTWYYVAHHRHRGLCVLLNVMLGKAGVLNDID